MRHTPTTYCTVPYIVLLSLFEFPSVLHPRAIISIKKLNTMIGEAFLIEPVKSYPQTSSNP